MKKRSYLIYIIIAFAVLLIPFAGMTFWPTNRTTENTVLSEWPSFIEDGKPNVNYLEEMGEYFEDHFAFRLQMLTANAYVWAKGLDTSTTDQVVAGEDDWLYFGGTMDDYTGRNQLSDRELNAIVHNLSMMRDYTEFCGGRLVVTVAPNKNTLYNSAMPYYYQKGETSNLERLVPLLEEEGIEYVDLTKAFQNEDEVLYFKRDSHWNNKGALLAYNTIMDTLGKEHDTYFDVPAITRKDHIGDIDEILYPLAAEPEENIYYNKDWGFEYVNDVTDNMDDWIETSNPDKEGTLLMYRDSFGESILPFFADEYNKAYFSRLVPYNMENLLQYEPDTVIVERVERQIAAFATEIPVMEGPRVQNIRPLEKETDTTLKTEQNGSYLVISGAVDQECIDEDTEIYVAVSSEDRSRITTYEAFWTLTNSGDGNGYQLYLRRDSLPSDTVHIDVITSDGSEQWIVGSDDREIVWE